MRSDIPRIGNEELASLGRDTAQRIRSFGHHVLPARCGIVEDDSSVGSVLVGQDEEFVADIVHHLKAVVRHLANNWSEGRLLPRKIVEKQRVAVFTLAALRNCENRKTFVFCRVHCVEALRVRLVLVNQPVVCLRGAQAMVVDLVTVVARRKIVPVLGRVVSTVKEPIAKPGKATHLQPPQIIFEALSGFNFQNVTIQPIRATAGKVIGKIASIAGSFSGHETHGTVRRKLVGIKQNPRRSL